MFQLLTFYTSKLYSVCLNVLAWNLRLLYTLDVVLKYCFHLTIRNPIKTQLNYIPDIVINYLNRTHDETPFSLTS